MLTVFFDVQNYLPNPLGQRLKKIKNNASTKNSTATIPF